MLFRRRHSNSLTRSQDRSVAQRQSGLRLDQDAGSSQCSSMTHEPFGRAASDQEMVRVRVGAPAMAIRAKM